MPDGGIIYSVRKTKQTRRGGTDMLFIMVIIVAAAPVILHEYLTAQFAPSQAE
jgi:hypothetical protein